MSALSHFLYLRNSVEDAVGNICYYLSMNEIKTTHSITSGSIVRTILFLMLAWVLIQISDLVLVVLAAVVIASSLEPATLWLAKYKIKRVPATILIYLGLVGALVCFFLFFVPSLANEVLVYLNSMPSTIDLSVIWSPVSNISSLNQISVRELVDSAREIVSGTGEGAFKTASVVFGGALSIVLMVVLSFYLAVQEDGVGSFLRLITPIKQHDYIIDLWKRSQRKIGFWMQGQLLLGVIVGILTYLGLMLLGVQHALLLATVAALLEIIPVFGPILAAIPALAIATTQGGASLALLTLGLYVIIHQFENHLLYPLVVKKIVGVSPIVVILALVIGAKLAGFLGALLSVPLAAAFMEYVNDIEKRKFHHHHDHTLS